METNDRNYVIFTVHDSGFVGGGQAGAELPQVMICIRREMTPAFSSKLDSDCPDRYPLRNRAAVGKFADVEDVDQVLVLHPRDRRVS